MGTHRMEFHVRKESVVSSVESLRVIMCRDGERPQREYASPARVVMGIVVVVKENVERDVGTRWNIRTSGVDEARRLGRMPSEGTSPILCSRSRSATRRPWMGEAVAGQRRGR